MKRGQTCLPWHRTGSPSCWHNITSSSLLQSEFIERIFAYNLMVPQSLFTGATSPLNTSPYVTSLFYDRRRALTSPKYCPTSLALNLSSPGCSPTPWCSPTITVILTNAPTLFTTVAIFQSFSAIFSYKPLIQSSIRAVSTICSELSRCLT